MGFFGGGAEKFTTGSKLASAVVIKHYSKVPETHGIHLVNKMKHDSKSQRIADHYLRYFCPLQGLFGLFGDKVGKTVRE